MICYANREDGPTRHIRPLYKGTRIVIVLRASPHCCVERDTSRLPLVEHIEMENINIIIKLF
jgi:hypothetical protein